MIILVILLIVSNLAWVIGFYLEMKSWSTMCTKQNNDWYKTCNEYVTRYYSEEHFRIDGAERVLEKIKAEDRLPTETEKELMRLIGAWMYDKRRTRESN